MRYFILLIFFCASTADLVMAQDHSTAREWNDVLLEAIRDDFARPTIHARNLFHTSVAMYDIWALYDDTAQAFLANRSVRGYECVIDNLPIDADFETDRKEAIDYASYRILNHRFRNSPGADESLARFDSLFAVQGHDPNDLSMDYENGSGAALGNYIANCLIEFGLEDGANEIDDYKSLHYLPSNPPLAPAEPGNSSLTDPNRWQPLSLNYFIDQSGNVVNLDSLGFLSPEWGAVTPFALHDRDLTIETRDDGEYWLFHDPGHPPYVGENTSQSTQEYLWGFCLVSMWSSHLDPSDGVMWDISPASMGNNPEFPTDFAGYQAFYKTEQGGDASRGYNMNPKTGQPYDAQIVPRGDFARVLAEFWADGPDSETPPGHWFTLLNYVSDHPEHVKKFRGEGEILDQLEWDVKSYLAMGGAMHDAAVTAWGLKGWYDYIRPISAIRGMVDRGQSTIPDIDSYTPDGTLLVPGFIDLITEDDPIHLRGFELNGVEYDRYIGQPKVRAWTGLEDNDQLESVDWIRAAKWWPYQRPSFVTPPFAGYVSGHSTFSRAAAEVMTLLTGDEYFPGGLGQFEAKANDYLVFEDGPSMDLTLQWATYRDAADQSALSRIWGGIHPPADDIPGRVIGIDIGQDAFELAEELFTGTWGVANETNQPSSFKRLELYPNPVHAGTALFFNSSESSDDAQPELYTVQGKKLNLEIEYGSKTSKLDTSTLSPGLYVLRLGSFSGKFLVY